MESANHEFTWLSGRAQASVAHEAALLSTEKQGPSNGGGAPDKPTALPRKLKAAVPAAHQQLSSSLDKPPGLRQHDAVKPTPLPRIFRRSQSATSIVASQKVGADHLYDLPPSPEGAVFYVATPKLAVVPAPVDKSIILEFDPILQNPSSISAADDSNLRLSRFFVDAPLPVAGAAADGDPAIVAARHSPIAGRVDGNLRRSLSATSASSSSVSSSSKDSGLEVGVAPPPKTWQQSGTSSPKSDGCSTLQVDLGSINKAADCGAVDRVANVYCDLPAAATPPPPSLPPRPTKDAILAAESAAAVACRPHYALPFDSLRAPELPPKSPTRHKQHLPLGFTLSSVPPPPNASASAPLSLPLPPKEPTSLPTTGGDACGVPPVRAVDNRFYQWFQGTATSAPPPPPRCRGGGGGAPAQPRDVVSIIDSGSSDDEEEEEPAAGRNTEPPRFPPPLFPLTQLPTVGCRMAEVSWIPTSPPPSYSSVASPECDARPPDWPDSAAAASPAVATPPPVPAKRGGVEALGNGVLVAAIPIYQNVLEIFGSREGVYAKINRVGAAEGTSAPSVLPPPPLPPRGRQRPAPPPLPPDPHAPRSASDVASQQARELHDNDHALEVLRCIPHCGTLQKIGRGRKDVAQKYMVLERGRLQCFAADKTDNPQEIFEQSDLLSVARISNSKQSDLSCFALVTRTCKDRPLLFGAKYPSEREGWIQHIVRSILPAGAAATTNAMNNHKIVKAGYLYLRTSVTGTWQTCWTVLTDTELQVTLPDATDQLSLNLRKVISLQELTMDPQMNVLSEDKPLFVVNYPAVTLYARSFQAFDTTDWFQRLQDATLTVGQSIEEQQLTHDGVPVIVDKCVKFVSVYGISTQGIYRVSATKSKVARLLELFRKDAQKVHLQQDDYSEHDIANALKRFFRELPDPLMTSALYSQWLALVGSPVEHYRELLKQLPEINYSTLKKVIGHLHSVSRLCEQNLMDVMNLAQVFGPTLLCNEGCFDLQRTGQENEVMAFLISNYAFLFGVSSEELDKEVQIQRALEDLREAKKAQKPAGDIMVGVYVHNRQWGKCLNVKVSPTMSAYDLCMYVTHHVRMKDRVDQLSVYEVVCDGELERPLHFSEMVLSVTLRWAGWADLDARNNYLMVKRNEIIQTILPMAQRPLSMFGELKFAEVKSKSFKKYMFEFKNARLAYYKDAKISQPLGSWNVEDITWYLGIESKRSPSAENARWSMTFVESKTVVNRSSKDAPYFGRCICFSNEVEYQKWIAALLIGQYPEGLVPRYRAVDLLS